MENKVLILGVLLIIGMFFIAPVSSVKIIDHGNKTFKFGDNESVNCQWTTYKYSRYLVKLFSEKKMYNKSKCIDSEKSILEIRKYGNSRIKLTITHISIYGKKKSSVIYHVKKGDPVRFYYGERFQKLYKFI